MVITLEFFLDYFSVNITILYCNKSKAKPTSSLFDEDEEEDLFTGTKSTAKKSTPQKVGSL